MPRSIWSLVLMIFALTAAGCTSPGRASAASGASVPPHAAHDRRPSWHGHRAEPGASRAWRGEARSPDAMEAYTSPGSLPQLRGGDGVPLPLRHTDVRAELRGSVAEVRVQQIFHNASSTPIEVVYAFALPENSAVSDLRMTIGDRVIESEIMRREQARAGYEHAKAKGHTASLLEQERPNLFTQSVSNIAPGEDIEVEIRYLQTLTYDAGEYEFVFPMVVGPRFIPGEPNRAGGTDAVPDAARISPPVLGHGTRSGHDISLSLRAQTGHPIVSWSTPTHDVEVESRDGGLRASLAAHDALPNRDFIMRYRVADPSVRATAFLGPRDAEGRGHFLMLVHPPAVDVDAEVGRREFVFVVDRSGSMYGTPLALAKQTVREMLSHMRPVDTFDVVGFASGTSRLFGAPRPANATNLVIALRFLDDMDAGGGTMMADAVQASLSDPVEAGFNRYVLFLTDGYIGNETAIFAGAEGLVDRLEDRGQVARVFGVGIGSSPNRHLIEGLSRAGSGTPHNISTREGPSRVVNAVMHRVDQPVLTDLRLPADGPLTVESYPATLPDLFVSHPVTLLGRYRGQVPATVELHARDGRRAITIPVVVRPGLEGDRTLSTLWARAKVTELESRLWHEYDPEVVEQITAVGLEHHIVTAYTSLLAVDRSRVIGRGQPSRVVQPTLAPEDVDPVMAGGRVVSNTAVGRTVSMEEFRNIPVGSATGRDFTQVVDSSATASGGSVGISLAGSTGAESSYTVEGASVNRVRAAPVSVPREFRSVAVDRADVRGAPVAHAHVGRMTGEGALVGRGQRTFRRYLREHLRRCVEGSPLYAREERAKLVLRLAVDETGRLEVELLSGTLGTRESDACVERAVTRASRSLSAGSRLTLPLRLWAN